MPRIKVAGTEGARFFDLDVQNSEANKYSCFRTDDMRVDAKNQVSTHLRALCLGSQAGFQILGAFGCRSTWYKCYTHAVSLR